MIKRALSVIRIDWLVDLGASVMAWIAYVGTLAPTISWSHSGADSGDLITAAWTGGVPHPPGYPLYMLLAGFAAHFSLGDPARNVNLLSALCAAATVFLLARTVRSLTRDDGEQTDASLFIAPLLALVFAFTPLFWSQATIAEVYSLHMLLSVALFAVLFSASAYRLVLAAAIVGFGLTHHLTMILLVPGAWVLLGERPSRQQIAFAIIALVLPLTLYLYLPIRAMADPPINWGGVTTLERFWWMVSGAAYRSYLFSLSPADLIARLSGMARLLFDQFGVWGVALGLWGFVQMEMMPRPRSRRQLRALMLSLVVVIAFALVYGSRDSFVYLLPVMIIFLLGMGYGAADLARRLPVRGAQIALLFALALFCAYNLIAHWQTMNLSQERQAFAYAEKIFRAIPNDAVVLADGDEHLFALWYYRYVVVPSSNVSVVSGELLQYDWYAEQTQRRLPWTSSATQFDRVTYSQRLWQLIDASLQSEHSVYSTSRAAWLDNYVTKEQEELFLIQTGRRQ